MVCCERKSAFGWGFTLYFQAVILLHVMGISIVVVNVGGVNNTDNQHLLPVKATNLTCTSNNFWNPNCSWISGDNVNATELLQDRSRYGTKWGTENKGNHCVGNVCYNLYPQRSTLRLFRVNTTNAYGSVVSDTVYFDAMEETVLGPPYDVRLTNMSQSALKVVWHVPPGNNEEVDHFKTLLEYRFQYKWEGENDTWKDAKDILQVQGSFGTYSLHDLTKPYGLYYVRINATRKYSSVQSKYSDEAKGRTSEIAAKDPPSDFHCMANPSSDGETRVVTLTWKPWDDPFKLNGEILGFDVNVKQGDESKRYRVEPSKTSYEIPDLDRYQHYKFSIQAVNSMGASPKEDCNIDPVKVASQTVWIVLAACGSTVGFIMLSVCIYQGVKKSMLKFPNITISPQLGTYNQYSANTVRGEAEVFDELIPHRLFVSLVPEEGVMTNGFDIGDKPSKTEVSKDTIKMNSFENHPLLPGFRDMRSRSEEFSFDEYGVGGLASSPTSVGSGGSYLHIRNDDTAYRTMTKDGLSPVEKEDAKGASGGGFDGFQELLPRSQSEGGASNSPDPYTPMALLLPTHGASSKMANHGGKAAQFGKKPPKDCTHANDDSAAYASDGSISNYAQQGLAASSPPQDDAESPYVLGTNPTDSYSQVGLRDRVNLPSPLNHQSQNQATGGLGPHDEYLRMGINASSSDPQEAENEDSDFEDFPFILNDDILQNIPRPDSLQISPNLNHADSPLMAPSPLPVAGIDDLQIPNSMRMESPNDDVFLRYVAVQADSESLDLDDPETEQEGDGYVTQGMIPDILNPRVDNRNALNVPGPTNLHSDYVGQEQLNNFPMPQTEPVPVTNNHPQQAGASSPNDYVTSEQVFDIRSPGPVSNSCNETLTNSNNNCEGSSDSDVSDDETKDASEYMIQGNECVTEDHDGANSVHPTCVVPDRIPSLTPPSRPQNVARGNIITNGGDFTPELTDGEDVVGDTEDQWEEQSGTQGDTQGDTQGVTKGERQDSDGGYVTHDEMQNIARVASPTTQQ